MCGPVDDVSRLIRKLDDLTRGAIRPIISYTAGPLGGRRSPCGRALRPAADEGDPEVPWDDPRDLGAYESDPNGLGKSLLCGRPALVQPWRLGPYRW